MYFLFAHLLSNKKIGLYCSLAFPWLAFFGPSTHTSGNERAGGRRQSAALSLPYNSKAFVLGATTLVLLAAGGYWFYTHRQRTPKKLSTINGTDSGNSGTETNPLDDSSNEETETAATSLQEAVTRDLEKEKDKKPKAFEETIRYLQQQTGLDGETTAEQLVTNRNNKEQKLWALAVQEHSISLLKQLFQLGFHAGQNRRRFKLPYHDIFKAVIQLQGSNIDANPTKYNSTSAYKFVLYYFTFREEKTKNKWFEQTLKGIEVQQKEKKHDNKLFITKYKLIDIMEQVGHDMGGINKEAFYENPLPPKNN